MEVRAGGVIGLDKNRGIISLHEMQPIELTEEFFTRNGFIEQVECDEYVTYFRSAVLRTEVFVTPDGWLVHIDDDHYRTVFCKCLKYVHELQNAYYISIGKELEVKL
jgi:hypothetical protein